MAVPSGMTFVILRTGDHRFKLKLYTRVSTQARAPSMSDNKTLTVAGTDWTRLLADPDLAQNIGKLLQAYREALPERREEALVAAMRRIKQEAAERKAGGTPASEPPQTRPTAASEVPPFEPDLFRSNWAQDRRKHPRIRCFIAVELRINRSETPIWGNLSNTSLGGCQVETASHIPSGVDVEIGLWIASGKVWVKGLALNGVVVRSAPANGVRIRFAAMAQEEKEGLREFLKYVQETTKASTNENNYLQLLKK
jgi:hypothetical protein